MKRQAIVAIITAVFLIVVGMMVASTDVKGQSNDVIQGRVTAIADTAIEVDRTSYPLSPDVIIRDKKKGRVREWNEVRVGREVTLHLAGGTVELIVVIVYD